MSIEPGIPLAGTITLREHDKINDDNGNKRVDIWGFDGSNWNRAKVSSAGELSTTGGGSGSATVQFDDGDAIDTTSEGVLLVGTTGIPGTARALRCTDPGTLLVDGSAVTQPISGTVTADTELPAASALTDSMSTPTTPLIGSCLLGFDSTGQDWDRVRVSPINADAMPGHAAGGLDVMGHNYLFNGTGWDRVRGDITNGIDVDVTRVTGTVTVDTEIVTKDYDTTGATETVGVVGIIVPSATGSVAITGDAANGLDVDVTRVQGTVTVDTELPAAVAMGAGMTNPTTPPVGAFSAEFNGTTWDRLRHSYTQTRGGLITTSGAGTVVDMTESPCTKFALQVIQTGGTVSAYNIQLEGSLNGSNFFTAVNGTSASGNDQIFWSADKAVFHMRSNVVSITGASGTVTVIIMAMR